MPVSGVIRGVGKFAKDLVREPFVDYGTVPTTVLFSGHEVEVFLTSTQIEKMFNNRRNAPLYDNGWISLPTANGNMRIHYTAPIAIIEKGETED